VTLVTGLQVRLIEYVRRVCRPLASLVFAALAYWLWPEQLTPRLKAYVLDTGYQKALETDVDLRVLRAPPPSA